MPLSCASISPRWFRLTWGKDSWGAHNIESLRHQSSARRRPCSPLNGIIFYSPNGRNQPDISGSGHFQHTHKWPVLDWRDTHHLPFRSNSPNLQQTEYHLWYRERHSHRPPLPDEDISVNIRQHTQLLLSLLHWNQGRKVHNPHG